MIFGSLSGDVNSFFPHGFLMDVHLSALRSSKLFELDQLPPAQIKTEVDCGQQFKRFQSERCRAVFLKHKTHTTCCHVDQETTQPWAPALQFERFACVLMLGQPVKSNKNVEKIQNQHIDSVSKKGSIKTGTLFGLRPSNLQIGK